MVMLVAVLLALVDVIVVSNTVKSLCGVECKRRSDNEACCDWLALLCADLFGKSPPPQTKFGVVTAAEFTQDLVALVVRNLARLRFTRKQPTRAFVIDGKILDSIHSVVADTTLEHSNMDRGTNQGFVKANVRSISSQNHPTRKPRPKTTAIPATYWLSFSRCYCVNQIGSVTICQLVQSNNTA